MLTCHQAMILIGVFLAANLLVRVIDTLMS